MATPTTIPETVRAVLVLLCLRLLRARFHDDNATYRPLRFGAAPDNAGNAMLASITDLLTDNEVHAASNRRPDGI
jgi:hypothetical protein